MFAQLVSKIFNLRGHHPPTSQTDRQTDDMPSQDRALHYSASRGKKIRYPNFTKFSEDVAGGHGSALLWQRCGYVLPVLHITGRHRLLLRQTNERKTCQCGTSIMIYTHTNAQILYQGILQQAAVDSPGVATRSIFYVSK